MSLGLGEYYCILLPLVERGDRRIRKKTGNLSQGLKPGYKLRGGDVNSGLRSHRPLAFVLVM